MFAVISLQQLEWMLDRGERLVLIDLREREVYEEGHLAGAVSLPYDRLEEEDLEEYRNCRIVFYCEHGGKSMRAARDFYRRGFWTASLGSGIRYYRGKYLAT
ncbi:MAG: rhodanese-like domain-containing protein [Lachnospiraceae bacterium]|nr:rhodanese-like domain-containing protein [Lachnospiraceae bacterium]